MQPLTSPPPTPLATSERLVGVIDTITFHNAENGFCVLRVRIKGQRELATVIGSNPQLHVGEFIESQGQWINDRKHGLQFKAEYLKSTPPSTLSGIKKYLTSGMIKGIGPHFGKILVDAFGEKVFEVIENEPEQLQKIAGIGKKRCKGIIAAWQQQKAVRDIMLFLHSYGVGSARAVRIYKTYGSNAVNMIRENPYRLANDIHGIGFKTADTIAQQIGIDQNAMIRAQAGVCFALQEWCQQGHVNASFSQLVEQSHALLEITPRIIEEAIEAEIKSQTLVSETIADERCIYLSPLYQAEVGIAYYIKQLSQKKKPWGEVDIEKAIPWVEEITSLQLAPSQQRAVATVLKNKIAIITGGPGVGKTTVVNSIIKILQAKQMHIALCAPTGRAAKRLTETSQLPAKTIHRLLEYDPNSHAFRHHQDFPLAIDCLIVDEASMIDTSLMYHLVKAIPKRASLLLVGDIDQLPAVGPGNVLADLINSGVIATARMTEIFRQAASSQIIVNAHRINQGEMPLTNQTTSDFFTIFADDPETIATKIIELVSQRLPQHYQCNPIESIQVLTPMNRGILGTRSLNVELQKILNGNSYPQITRFGWTYAPGDKVIQSVNNYDKNVFNGDIGTISRINTEEGSIFVNFEQQEIEYDTSELDELNLAYAITIHKSQGSEYPIVVLPLSTQHYPLLARNLLYTGVTRGKKIVVLVGQKKAIHMAVTNQKSKQRITQLQHRLQNNKDND